MVTGRGLWQGCMKKKSRPVFRARHKQLLAMLKESWPQLAISMVCGLVISSSTAATAWLIKPVLDDIFIKRDVHLLKLIPVAVVALYMLRSIAMFAEDYLMSYIGQDLIRRLRNRLFEHIQELPLGFFHQERTGALMSRLTNDVNIIKNMVSGAVTGSIKDCLTIIGLIFVIFYQIWQLALIAFVILPIAFLPVVSLGRRVRRISRGCQESMADLNSYLHETFAGTKIVKAFGRENYEKMRFFDRTLELFKLEMKEVIARSLSSPINEILAGVGIAFIIWYGGSNVIAGTYTTGTFVSFLAAVLMLYEPVKKMSKLNNLLQQGLAATDRIFDILERESEIKEAPNPVQLETKPHTVTFDQVYFKYDDKMVLKGINLDVKPGEVIALVGVSGGGKTTLVNLIPRFYDVSRGSIRIDGIDIRDVSISLLRRQIAIVTQEPILFNDSFYNNIAYGKPGASQEEARLSARAAYADEFIRNCAGAFDTNIGELGVRLSGGQKQRICIARALIKDAPILILDEATSSLDTESEAVVQRALDNLMQGRTTFVIAHRLSTVIHADRIVVIEEGRIVEEGKHDRLMALGGAYFKLYQMQFDSGASLDRFGEDARGADDSRLVSRKIPAP
jgi:subfamily B ATP-binding cassette protein MsbA